jgi:hypothetical protein
MLSYTGRLGLVQRLVAMLQDDGVTRVSYQGPTDAGGTDPDATETVLLGVRVLPGPEAATHVRERVDEFVNRHHGVAVSVEQPATPDPSRGSRLIAELESLARLHEDGHLTDEEFRQAKTLLLGDG